MVSQCTEYNSITPTPTANMKNIPYSTLQALVLTNKPHCLHSILRLTNCFREEHDSGHFAVHKQSVGSRREQRGM